MEFIKGNNQTTETKIKIVTALPATGNENDIILVKEDGIYQYKNSQWNCVTSFIAAVAPPIIGEIRASIGTPDSNWLLCNGGTFAAASYPQLYSLLGSTTLPDFREVIPVGVGTNGTDSVVDHDTFTLGQKKDWNLQTHCHSKTENNHTHAVSATFSHKHKYPIFCWKYYNYNECCYNLYCGAHYGRWCYNTNVCVWSALTVGSSSGKWCTAPAVGNPSSGTAILRVNSYGVNFYIRAK